MLVMLTIGFVNTYRYGRIKVQRARGIECSYNDPWATALKWQALDLREGRFYLHLEFA